MKVLSLAPLRLNAEARRPSLELGAVHQVAADPQHLVKVAQVSVRPAGLIVAALAQDHRLDSDRVALAVSLQTDDPATMREA